MLVRKAICAGLLFLICISLPAQKMIQAVKTEKPPLIDGILTDSVWSSAPVIANFIQNFPHVGQASEHKTEVRILYDDAALYIGAYLFDDPSLIRKQLSPRDEEQLKDLDLFSIFIDTYNDHQNGFQFLVTSSNVQSDARLSPSIETGYREYGDKTWDAVWDSKVTIQPDGWIVEMKIPFFSLRFARKNVQDWGIQLLRQVRRDNELSFWNFVDPEVDGFVNQFGVMKELTNIIPPLRLSFSPYLSTGARSTPTPTGFRNEWLRSGGMDVKYGINESFTLDATLIPDFGQVISDNVVNNLTPFEVKFDDYRPFFTEGTEIFNKAGLFYSRRIGATPTGYQAIHDLELTDPNIIVDKNPGRTQLYNAIKFSGRTEKKLGIGILNAVTAPMYAHVTDKASGLSTKYQTETLSNYNIIVFDQALKGRSYITFTNTNVLRNGNARDANVSGLNLNLYDKSNTYNFRAAGAYSKVFTTTNYNGFYSSVRGGKVSGRWQYGLQNVIRSKNYDPTDLGYLQTSNQVISIAEASYNQFKPTNSFLSYNYELTVNHLQLYQPYKFNEMNLEASGLWVFKNFWDVRLNAFYTPDQHDYFVLGRSFTSYARRPKFGFAEIEGSTDSRKRLFINYDFGGATFFNNKNKDYFNISGGVRYRFSNRLSLNVSTEYEKETDYIINAGTSMGRPRIAFVDFKEVTSTLSGIYNFTSRINLTTRIRHYWSNVIVKRLAGIDDHGNAVNPSPVTGLDENVNFFNVDAFFTWDFRYGSRLILGYKNWIGEDQEINGIRYPRYFGNLGEILSLRHGNELTVRFIYFLNYSQLTANKKKSLH